jgi:3D-(3,5/4)-trihydroxycyclohexane-1,2-dione acylhydrolase (decyclizing)
MPQHVQTEALDDPFIEKRICNIPGAEETGEGFRRATEIIRAARRPLLMAESGALNSEASLALANFFELT